MKNTIAKITCSVLSSSVLLISSAAQAFAAYTFGDVNNNGYVDAVDASLILSEYANNATHKGGTFTEEQRKAADVNHDNYVDAVDASYILAYYAYTSTSGTLDLETFVNGSSAATTAPVTTTTTTTTVNTTVDYSKDILGFWELNQQDEENTNNYGLFFTKEGTGGIFDMTSDLFYFSGNDFYVTGSAVSSGSFKEENGTITVDNGKEKLIEMSRIESTDGYLGTYHLYGGVFYNTILNGFKKDRNAGADSVYSVIDFYEEGKSRIVYNNFFTYKLDGNRLTITTNENLTPLFNGAGTVTIIGNTLTMAGGDEAAVFTKVTLPSDEKVLK
ncbi:dockerin type I domain-containing protein [Ruminococcus flavefaciens]|uniref:dockerin type I domain-containing protein n=1 Tax=Ruminococcus flavefaciens TaxID=1265 RepID=UPI00048F9BF1|nr:dockerin type I domain-containing protein [Ruminococcus flavefaciens]